MKKVTRPSAAPVADPETALILRTCNADMTSHGTFTWPKAGPVEAPNWNPAPVCGGGLHGLMWGEGDWSLLSRNDDAIWQVVRVLKTDVVKIDEQKVKFPRGEVIYTGHAGTAIVKVLCDELRMKRIAKEAKGNAVSGRYSRAASSGDSSSAASSGDYSSAASSGDYSSAASSGYYSRAASSGDYSRAASSGDSSSAASSGDYSRAASSGDSSSAASSGDSSSAASSGDKTIAMVAGLNGAVKAGPNGAMALAWTDKAGRPRITVLYVDEDGIEADTWYRLDASGKPVKA